MILKVCDFKQGSKVFIYLSSLQLCNVPHLHIEKLLLACVTAEG